MKSLITVLIMGLVFSTSAVFAKDTHAKSHKVAKAKAAKHEKKKKDEKAEPAQEDNMNEAAPAAPTDDSSAE